MDNPQEILHSLVVADTEKRIALARLKLICKTGSPHIWELVSKIIDTEKNQPIIQRVVCKTCGSNYDIKL